MDRDPIISLSGLSSFKVNYDIEIAKKISESGVAITKKSITDALGYTPANENDMPQVDSTYSSTSVNAMSGVAVAEGIKTEAVDGNYKVYYEQDTNDKLFIIDESEYNKILIPQSTPKTFTYSCYDFDGTYSANKLGSAYYENGALTKLEVFVSMNGDTFIIEIDPYRFVKKTVSIKEKLQEIDNLPTNYAPVDAQANVIETVKVNGTTLTPSNKAVDVSVPTESTVTDWGFIKISTDNTFVGLD